MQTVANEYFREKKYAFSHLLLVLSVTLVGFLVMMLFEDKINLQTVRLKMLFIGISLFSFFYYVLVVKFPNTLTSVRKLTLFLVDIIVLTVIIVLVGPFGLFLLPLYILIVLESGVRFGFSYFYFTLMLSLVSWATLIFYSSYWAQHIDTVVIFAITALLIPLVYLKQMIHMNKRHDTLSQTLESASHDANFDVLTGLPNRKQYDTFMKNLIQEKEFFALLFLDLNKFKVINDTHGHDVGDEILREVSRRLSSSLDEDDMLARLGGDEFVIITKRKKVYLPKFLQKLEALTIGNHAVNGITVHIDVSIGVSLFPDDGTLEIFLRKYADEAMYMAKTRKDTSHVYYEEIKSKELKPSEDFL